MKLTKLLLTSGLVALSAMAAQAASIPTIGNLNSVNANSEGDLVLGFYNPSVTNNLVVDIGPASDYYSTALASLGGTLTPGATYTVDAYNSADLTTVFGSNAQSASTQWAVIGGNGALGGPSNEPPQSIWTTATSFKAPQTYSQAQQTGTSLVVDTLTNQLAGGAPVSATGSQVAMTIPSSGAGSFNLAFNTVQGGQSGGVVVTGTTAASSSLALWYLPSGGTAVDLGTFNLSSSALTFTSFAAIPEPSTYAMILGALTVGFVALRRRFSKAV